jgi:endonuclease IV
MSQREQALAAAAAASAELLKQIDEETQATIAAELKAAEGRQYGQTFEYFEEETETMKRTRRIDWSFLK